MARYELTEFEWKVVQPLLPNKPRGVPRVHQQAAAQKNRLETLVSVEVVED
jgi:transposase